MFEVTKEWKETFPQAVIGILSMDNTTNPATHPILDDFIGELELEIRNNFSKGGRPAIRALPAVKVYSEYYRRFKKTYHIQLQIESVALKNRALPRISSLVSAMFAAELKNQLLTAGHDMSTLQPPLRLDVSKGHESYNCMNGKKQTLSSLDMFISDSKGVISSIIYGPDNRTPITSNTKSVLFTVYGPPGISPQMITSHLEDIRKFVHLASPHAQTTMLEIVRA